MQLFFKLFVHYLLQVFSEKSCKQNGNNSQQPDSQMGKFTCKALPIASILKFSKQLAPASFLIDFGCHNYGMLSPPNVKDIHDQNMSLFGPQPFFIAGFFFPQQLFQLAWLYRLYKLDPTKSLAEKQELDKIVDFVLYHSLGYLCIAGKHHHATRETLLKKSFHSSMDGSMELISSGHFPCLRYREHPHSTILCDSQAAAHDLTLDLLHPHSHCFKDFCRNRCVGFLA